MERSLHVTLPCGLLQANGQRARDARLTPLTGRAEARAAEESNPFRAALYLLCESLSRIGGFEAAEVDVALLAGMYPVDRDFLLVQLSRLMFGDVIYQTVVCPETSCAKRVDLALDLRSLAADSVEVSATRCFVLPDGRQGVLRLATAGDQAELYGVAESELEACFLARCMVPTDGCEANDWRSIPEGYRARIVEESVRAAPTLDVDLDLVCVECGHDFSYVYEPLASLLSELRQGRAGLRRDVHCIASHYHWSEREILNLTRAERRAYIELIEADYPSAWS